jgi:hypothetical protein
VSGHDFKARRSESPWRPALRACDFFVFSQKQILKTNDLCAKKSHKFKKVTNSERSRRVPEETEKRRALQAAEKNALCQGTTSVVP